MKVISNEDSTYTLIADSESENQVVTIVQELVTLAWAEMAGCYGPGVADDLCNDHGLRCISQVGGQSRVGRRTAVSFYNYCTIPGEDFLPED